MEANKKRYQYENIGSDYTEGNTVRKLDSAAPDIRRQREPYQVPSPRRQEHRQPRSFSGINFGSLMVLTIAIIATVYVCVEYLKMQNEVSQMNKTIVSMEKQLKTLTHDNDAAYEQINTNYDLDYVYRVAVEELGMVYPNKNEVITYKKGSEDYVRQYEDIPD